MTTSPDLLTLTSHYTFDDTLQRLREAFADKGLTIFAEIDHQAAAKAVGLDMPPASVLIFGNPKGGTPLMQANLQVAVELPLKVLVSEPKKGQVDVVCVKAAATGARHGLSDELIAAIAGAEK